MTDGWRFGLAAAVGGAVGAGARWLVGVPFDLSPTSFPVPTLIVNLVGCLAIGFVAGRIPRESPWWTFVVTGVLGGFTTMAAFAQELNDLADADRTGVVAAYLLATVGGATVAVLLAERATESLPW